ncbi:MAG: PTS sugar transporter subunit IIA [Clostridiales bacterium]|jgi:transcriptional antiterminator/mannitol/fructose-specific phosphotransferase system IIA component (Ntr-type)|nr:PTS sugar transporter subunit IIA [Clostridiales bacterium]
MNKQTRDLLLRILNARNKWFSYQELADAFSVSTRSIRNYITTINEFLASAAFSPIYPNAAGEIGFSGSFEQAQAIQERLLSSDFYTYRLAPEERHALIRLLLLCRDVHLTITDFTERLLISRGTFLKDMEAVEQGFAQEGIRFGVRNKGYLLEISEGLRRQSIAKCVTLLLSDQDAAQEYGVYREFVEDILHFSLRESSVTDALKSAERHYGIDLSDAAFQKLALYLSINALRMQQQRFIGAAGPLPGGAYKDIAAFILHELCDRIDLPYSEAEMCYLARLVQTHIAHNRDVGDAEFELHISVKSFLYRVADRLNLPLDSDETLQASLVTHIRNSLSSGNERERISRYQEAFAHQYPKTYQAVEASADMLRLIGYCNNKEEFLAVLMLVLTAIEQYYTDAPPIRALVVCNTGMVTANFLTVKLQRLLRIQIQATVPLHRLKDALEVHGCDMIISTLPLESSFPWVQISPVLTGEDMQRVQTALQEVDMQRSQTEAYRQAQRVFDNYHLLQHLAGDVHVEDWRSAIRRAGELLEDGSGASSAYTDAMIRVVEQYGPYIVFAPGIALAHALSQTDGRNCASLIKLREPVLFGHPQNDPVRYVLAVCTQNEREHLQALFHLMNMMCDERLSAALDVAQTTTELREAIVQYVRH